MQAIKKGIDTNLLSRSVQVATRSSMTRHGVSSSRLHLSEARLPASLRLLLLFARSCEAAGVKLPMPGGDFGDGCAPSCAVDRMNTPLAVLPGNPRT